MTREPAANQVQQDVRIQLARARRKLLSTAICATLVCVSITILSELMWGDSGASPLSLVVSNGLAIATSGSAFFLSVVVINRQKIHGVFPRIYLSLGIALALWFAAETIWAYYEIGTSIETPFPSLADGFWLAGYAPFFYFLAGILRNFVGMPRLIHVIPVVGLAFALLTNVLISIYDGADLTSQEGILSYAIAVAYPVADIFLIIPAIAAFIQLRRGQLTFAPWSLIVTATLMFTVGDIGFAYSAIIEEMGNLIWIWNPLYNIAYISIASALFWHKSFFTVSEKKIARDWQENNR